MFCQICFTECSVDKLIKGPDCTEWTCHFCSDCLATYLCQTIHNFSFQIDQKIRCPYFKCTNSYSAEDWLAQLHGECYNKIAETLLSTYKRSQLDIHECQECGWWGYSEPKLIPQWKCEECGVCHKERSDSQNSLFAAFYRSISQGEIINELCSQIYKALWTDSCPSCKISILKNRGCPHMICKKCNYEFCWCCKQPHLTHNSDLCVAQMLIKIFLAVYLSLMILALFSYHTIIWNIISFCISFTLRYILFYNGFIFLIIMLFVQIQDEYRLRNQPSMQMKSILPYIIVNSSFIFTVFVIIYCYGLINELFKTVINEIILITIAGTTKKVGQFVWDNWLMFVK